MKRLKIRRRKQVEWVDVFLFQHLRNLLRDKKPQTHHSRESTKDIRGKGRTLDKEKSKNLIKL